MAEPSLATRLAVIKTVQKGAAEAEAAVKALLEEQMEPGERKRAVVDGQNAGTITFSEKAATARITDSDAFLMWVAANHPGELHHPIAVEAEELIDAMNYAFGTDREARNTYRKVMAALGTAIAHPRVRDGFATKILADVVKAKAAVDTTTGEEIPGVEYVPPGRGFITARVSDAQIAVIGQAWAEGKIDLLDLATTVPELEGVKP
jgi:hypothetical protein